MSHDLKKVQLELLAHLMNEVALPLSDYTEDDDRDNDGHHDCEDESEHGDGEWVPFVFIMLEVGSALLD